MVRCDGCGREFESNQKFLQDVIDGTAAQVLCPVCQAVAAFRAPSEPTPPRPPN